jgi:hypothetical protein
MVSTSYRAGDQAGRVCSMVVVELKYIENRKPLRFEIKFGIIKCLPHYTVRFLFK